MLPGSYRYTPAEVGEQFPVVHPPTTYNWPFSTAVALADSAVGRLAAWDQLFPDGS